MSTTYDDATVNGVIEQLRARGAVITFPEESARLMTLQELRETYAPKLTPGGLWKRLQHHNCPPFYAERGESGRIKRLRPTPGLIAWVQAEPSPRKAVKVQKSEIRCQMSEEGVGTPALPEDGGPSLRIAQDDKVLEGARV